ncbi:lipopolysaccharide assembly LapA domain-containing protein [Alteribacillus sp. JSM 102045]|uniref:LapA family protein n=1 Tax=Alteribacillus sp. JSM 102045 TaxID=1562101 RepID=UPI0035BF12E3
MRGQSVLILGIITALVIAIFAVINVDGVEVNYLFGSAEWPLILVILGSVLMGAIIVGSLGMLRVYRLQQEVKHWKRRAQNPADRDGHSMKSRSASTMKEDAASKRKERRS